MRWINCVVPTYLWHAPGRENTGTLVWLCRFFSDFLRNILWLRNRQRLNGKQVNKTKLGKSQSLMLSRLKNSSYHFKNESFIPSERVTSKVTRSSHAWLRKHFWKILHNKQARSQQNIDKQIWGVRSALSFVGPREILWSGVLFPRKMRLVGDAEVEVWNFIFAWCCPLFRSTLRVRASYMRPELLSALFMRN